MIGIVVSRQDDASLHIWEHLQQSVSWERCQDDTRSPDDGGGECYRYADFEARTFGALHLDLVRPADAFENPEFVVFVSRHAGATGRLLTAHFPGNVGDATYGGTPGELSDAAPAALSRVVSALQSVAPAGYDVGIECTHHGPSDVGAPAMFVELGSDEAAWRDPAGAKAVSAAVLTLAGTPAHRDRTVVGIGGGHYAPKFERIVHETDWDVGHIAAGWALAEVGSTADQAKIVREAMARSASDLVVIDGEHSALAERLAAAGVRIVSETWLRETTGVPLAVIDDVVSRLGPVNAGTRFGDRVDGLSAQSIVRMLPERLLSEVYAIDADRTRAVVTTHAIAYETSEAGNRLEPRVLVPTEDDYDAIVERFVAILEDRYETVEREPAHVIVREERFDPDAARALGIPDGPLFGMLAAGESIKHDGRTVRPDAVTTVDERRIPTRPT